MQTANSPTTSPAPLSADELARAQSHFAEHGYAVFPGVISKEKLAELHRRLQAEFERWKADGRLFDGGGNLTGHLNCFPGEDSRWVYDELVDKGIIDAIRRIFPKAAGQPNVGMNFNLPKSVAQHYHADRPFTQEFIICNIAVVDTEIANGFANRFLFALVRRSKKLPEGGSLDSAALDELARRVGGAIERAYRVGVLTRSPAAKDLWAKAYEDFGDGEEGLAGAVTARAEAQALRLSVVYALLDGSALIEVEHLEAALAVWNYCEASAYLIFGDATGDPVADTLLAAIREASEKGLDGTEQHRVLGGHASATRLALARTLLEGKRLIVTTQEETRGRPRLVSRAVTR